MKLDGDWIAAEAHLAGDMLPEDIISSFRLSVAADSYTVHTGAEVDKGSIKYFQFTVPMGIDIISEEGPNKGRTIKAIYKHSGGFLFVCYNLYGDDRPKTFTSTPENKFYLVRYKRALQ